MNERERVQRVFIGQFHTAETADGSFRWTPQGLLTSIRPSQGKRNLI